MAKVKMPRSYPCIDVDTELDYPKPYYVDPLGLEKAVFQYSFIRRRVFKTNHGYHIYLLIRVDDAETVWRIRAVFGDDYGRLQYDESAIRRHYVVNKCFTSSEKYEVDISYFYKI